MITKAKELVRNVVSANLLVVIITILSKPGW
jgi:hypothetical protein